MSNLAIITARGGSKRIPRKNIKDFCGKPILAYSIEAAQDSGIFDEIMVSTDDEEIARVAREYGAQVPFLRSASTSNDYATTVDVLQEVLGEYEKRGQVFEAFACLYPTAPFLTGEKIRQAYQTMEAARAQQVVSVVQYSFPPQRAFVVEDGRLVYQYPQYALTRSQDLPPIYHDCGQFYLYKTQAFLEKTGPLCDLCLPFVLSELEVQDIDTPTDWVMAEEKMKAWKRRQKGEIC